MGVIVSLLCGLVFGLGLIVSGMINPAKIQNFLDIAGTWDPSLAFVMAGAIPVTLIGYRLLSARSRPVLGETFCEPPSNAISARLITGSAMFGAGWGLAGFCPGPALTGLTLAAPATLVFAVAMLAGIVAGHLFLRGRDSATLSTFTDG